MYNAFLFIKGNKKIIKLFSCPVGKDKTEVDVAGFQLSSAKKDCKIVVDYYYYTKELTFYNMLRFCKSRVYG